MTKKKSAKKVPAKKFVNKYSGREVIDENGNRSVEVVVRHG